MELLLHFQDALRGMGIVQGQQVVVGVSGGPDSLTLLHLFVQSQAALGIVPTAVHVHHGMRGDAADADAGFMEEIGRDWQVDCRVERVDVPGLVRDRGYSLEEAARKARYTVLSQIAREVGSEVVAVAHHADDQAETVLLHLLRGAGLAGLRGMLPVTRLSGTHVLHEPTDSLKIIRPLLDVPRDKILAYCQREGLTPREDETNEKTAYLRNRIRHAILPVLRDVSPHISQRLAQTARVLQADFNALEMLVDQAWEDTLVEEDQGSVSFHRDRWKELPLAMQRGIIRRAVQHLQGSMENLGFEHVEGAVQIGMSGDPGARALFPGEASLAVEYKVIRVSRSGYRLPTPDWPILAEGDEIALQSWEGHQSLEVSSEWMFRLETYEGPRDGALWEAILHDPWKAVVSADAFSKTEAMSLRLRTRRPGDRFQPQGVQGTQKLSDFYTNEKIRADLRDRLPLLVTGQEGNKIVWVCGFRMSERFLVRTTTRRVLLARFDRIPEGRDPNY